MSDSFTWMEADPPPPKWAEKMSWYRWKRKAHPHTTSSGAGVVANARRKAKRKRT